MTCKPQKRIADGVEYTLVSMKRDKEGNPLWYRYKSDSAITRYFFDPPPSDVPTRTPTPRGFSMQATMILLTLLSIGKKLNILP